MWRRWVRAGLFGAIMWCTSTLAQAQCTKDLECKGDRICEEGRCTAPPPEPAPAPSGAPAPEPAPASAPAPVATTPGVEPTAPVAAASPAAAPTPGAASSAASAPAPASTSQLPAEQSLRRRSPGALAGGIIMVSIGSLLLGVGAVAHSQEGCPHSGTDGDAVYRCNDRVAPSTYALFITGGLLAAGSIPMIIYGAKRVPAAPQTTASLQPWATRNGAGLRVRFEL